MKLYTLYISHAMILYVYYIQDYNQDTYANKTDYI